MKVPASPVTPSTDWPSRIVREASVDPYALTPHPLNWRTHPTSQAEALTDVLDRVGWVQRVIVNERTGHILDGHLRVAEASKRGVDVPVVYVDLSEEEERLVLATMDPLALFAGRDQDIIDELLTDLEGVPDDVFKFLSSHSQQNKVLDDLTADTPEIDPDDFSGEHRCPKCGFEFDDT